MNIIHMNEGYTITASLDECILTLGDSLMIDIDEEQRDVERVITVFADASGALSFEGGTFAAVIIIPPRRYAEEEVTEIIDGEGVTEIIDGEGVTQTISVPQPCQVSAVTLQLWAVPKAIEPTETEE